MELQDACGTTFDLRSGSLIPKAANDESNSSALGHAAPRILEEACNGPRTALALPHKQRCRTLLLRGASSK